MFEFVRKAFRGGIEVILWLNLILWAIGGGVIGSLISWKAGEYIFLGVVIGIIFGLLTDIVGGGFIATVLNIDKNIEEQNNPLRQQSEFIPTHRVKLLTATDGLNLRKTPNEMSEPFTNLPEGTEIKCLETGYMAELAGIKAPWFKIITKDNICGWCISGSLEKM